MKKTMNLKKWRDELREDRKDSPVETFCLLLLLGFCCLLTLAVFGILLYYLALPVLIIVGTITILWIIYTRYL